MPSPLIHIGYQKTGSTWLRQHLFNNTEVGFTSPFSRNQLLEQLVYPHAFDFDPDRCRAFFEADLSEADGRGLRPVISLERLSGNPVSGGYDTKELADRIANTFPEGRVFIVIREQKSMILSSYKQYVKGGGPSSLKGYLDPPQPRRIPYFDFDHYKYDRLIKYYRDLLGISGVLVLPFEMFKRSPCEFVKQLGRFVYPDRDLSSLIRKLPWDEPVNVGYSGPEMAIKRRMSMLIGERNSLNLHSLVPAGRLERGLFRAAKMVGVFNLVPRPMRRRQDRKLSSQVAQMVSDRYVDSNRQTAQLTGIDLTTYGYDLGANRKA